VEVMTLSGNRVHIPLAQKDVTDSLHYGGNRSIGIRMGTRQGCGHALSPPTADHLDSDDSGNDRTSDCDPLWTNAAILIGEPRRHRTEGPFGERCRGNFSFQVSDTGHELFAGSADLHLQINERCFGRLVRHPGSLRGHVGRVEAERQFQPVRPHQPVI
jgi:hypothetical protein